MTEIFMDKIVEFIESTTYQGLSEEMKETSKLSIVDTVGVALAGWNEPSVQILKKTYVNSPSKGEVASLWGESEQVPLEYAALINGTASHALDFDDVSATILAHPSAPVVAAILPLAEYLDKPVEEIITAYAIGTQVMIKVGQVMGYKHYDLGWHATSTLGTIGATAACGFLMEFNKEILSNAIALSASMAGGLQKNFGTMIKPLHVGIAAQHAIQSVLLAKEGFEGNGYIFEERGFFQAFTGSTSFEDLAEKMKGTEFDTLHDYEINGLSVKKFPCCYFTHRFIDGILEIRNEKNLVLDDVEEVNILVPPNGLSALIHSKPITGLQGKFSAEYTCLAALEDGKIQLDSFTDKNVKREKIQKSFNIIKAKEYGAGITDPIEMEEMPVYVSVKMKEGKVFEKEILHAPGSKGKPMTLNEYEDKWSDCLAFSRGNKINSEIKNKIKTIFQQGIEMEASPSIKDWLLSIENFVREENCKIIT